MRWRLLLSLLFGFLPVLIGLEGVRENATLANTALVVGVFYPLFILSCMVFAQADGIHESKAKLTHFEGHKE